MGSAVEEAIAIPFDEGSQLVQLKSSVPGYPTIPVDSYMEVRKFLIRELSTLRLRRLYWMLFLASNRWNIKPLHHQLFNSRRICITEQPDLHLVWYYDRIFIKPIPMFLFSYRFWAAAIDKALDGDGHRLILDALGFLRTYSSLIVHESDFEIAKKEKLLPYFVRWNTWCIFIRGFATLRDRDVSPRYHYGEIRLTRLNLWHRVFWLKSYEKVHNNYATFFARFGAPYLFVFGAATVVLTALQTGQDAFPDHHTYTNIISKFVPFTLALTTAGVCFLPALFLLFLANELVGFIICHRHLS
ncbi:hypothetical protein CcaCcLH18_05296 [Colletotrichum camelliae]|nr:hypothetical protein CcaCcLH18_05296 [Colletotrichum camelliae]